MTNSNENAELEEPLMSSRCNDKTKFDESDGNCVSLLN